MIPPCSQIGRLIGKKLKVADFIDLNSCVGAPPFSLPVIAGQQYGEAALTLSSQRRKLLLQSNRTE